MEYDNTNRGALWRNERKQTDKHPDYTGEVDVEGVVYWVSAWKGKTGNNPKAPILSFSLKKKEPRSASQNSETAHSPAPNDDFDDDIPF
jgi:hypothetical protein